MLNVTIQISEGVAHLICRGRLVHGPECEILRQIAEERNETNIVIDLTDVQSIDAAGLGTLVFLQYQLELMGRELSLLSPSPTIVDLLRLTGLENVLNVRQGCVSLAQ
jgi:anti-anti-sigma factor